MEPEVYMSDRVLLHRNRRYNKQLRTVDILSIYAYFEELYRVTISFHVFSKQKKTELSDGPVGIRAKDGSAFSPFKNAEAKVGPVGVLRMFS